MEENLNQSCSSNKQKCCSKGIIIVVICSLVCFFVGYYAGSKSTKTAARSNINRPFSNINPTRIPKIQQMPTVQPSRPPISTPKIQKMPKIATTPNINPTVNNPVQKPAVQPQTKVSTTTKKK